MMNDPNVKPFVDDLVRQLRGYLDQKNIRFGMTIADIEDVHSGEICLAGVLRKSADGSDENGTPEHAIVLLIDVSDSREKAEELLEKISEVLTGREATEKKIEIDGVTGSKWSFKKPQGLRQKQFAFHALAGDWLVATDNENTFRDIVKRIGDAGENASVLAETEAFKKVLEKCNFESEDFSAHIRWFIEPFGYIQLAQAIAEAQSGDALRDNYAEKFHEEGFSAIKGVGGVVSIATGTHETAHRTFVYAPPEVDGDDRYKRAAAMMDFRNLDGNNLDPPRWVPSESAGYLTFTWDLKKALNKVGYIIDKTSGTEGSFERALDSLEKDPKGPQVDMRKLVENLNNRITVCSVTELPIGDDSEQIVFGIKIRDDDEFVSESIYRLVRNDAEVIDFNGTRILVVDTAEVDGLEFDFEDDFDDEFGGDALAEEDDDENEEEVELKPAKPLFEKRVFAVKNGYLLVGNNIDQIKSIIEQLASDPGKDLAEASDYIRVQRALEDLSGSEAPSFRHFGRLDRTLQTNYEMMRTGRMAQSKTVFAQLLNRAYSKDDAPEDFVREQKVDGSKMPEDYKGQVAKYFGPTGMVVHTQDDGWLITGIVLKKEVDEMSTKSKSTEELVSDDK